MHHLFKSDLLQFILYDRLFPNMMGPIWNFLSHSIGLPLLEPLKGMGSYFRAIAITSVTFIPGRESLQCGEVPSR